VVIRSLRSINWEDVLSLKSKLDTLFTVLLGSCALVVTTLYVRREFSKPQPPKLVLDQLDKWRDYKTGSKMIGNVGAPVNVMVVSDFQCPFCKKFADNVRKLQVARPGKISITYVNFPLTQIHAQARSAAIAAECAAKQSKFEQYHDYLFSKQDSLAALNWTAAASVAGVDDTVGFKRCLTDVATLQQLRADSSLSAKFNVNATPTVYINGWRFSSPPTDIQLDSAVQSLLLRADRASR